MSMSTLEAFLSQGATAAAGRGSVSGSRNQSHNRACTNLQLNTGGKSYRIIVNESTDCLPVLAGHRTPAKAYAKDYVKPMWRTPPTGVSSHVHQKIENILFLWRGLIDGVCNLGHTMESGQQITPVPIQGLDVGSLSSLSVVLEVQDLQISADTELLLGVVQMCQQALYGFYPGEDQGLKGYI